MGASFFYRLPLVLIIINLFSIIHKRIRKGWYNMRKRKSLLFLMTIIIFVLSLLGCSSTNTLDNKEEILNASNVEVVELENEEVEKDTITERNIEKSIAQNNKTDVGKLLRVHFLNVGQADSTFIEFGSKTMLVDGGETKSSNDIIKYIEALGYSKIDYVIATHPHADHIGGLPKIIDYFDIGEIFMPNVMHTTKTFENLLYSIQSKGKGLSTPSPGDTLKIDDSNIVFLSPQNKEYDNLNNYSIAFRIDHGRRSFILTGDAEKEPETEMINSGINLKTDVLKLGHHGSDTSSTEGFIKATNPSYSVISIGEGNKYGHPNQTIIDRLIRHNSKILMTYKEGTIIFETDGEELRYKSIPGLLTDGKNNYNREGNNHNKAEKTIEEKIEKNSDLVYITKTGSKYHKAGCRHLSNSAYESNLDNVLNSGYEPCKVCNP